MTRVALIGDVHDLWGEADVRYFNESDYDALIFVGDLAGYRQAQGRRVARSIARLNKPALVVPGNHDGANLPQLAAEVLPRLGFLRPMLGSGQERRCATLRRALGPATMGGYSRHDLAGLSIVVGRPHSCGGPRLAFVRHAAAVYGVRSLEDSARKMMALVDQCDDRPIVFVAHNGPKGLGESPGAPCGRDFHSDAGDWGDDDLRAAIDYARETGREVAAVLFGHMHHRLRGGGRRNWQLMRDGITYVNAARVPRVFVRAGIGLRHHVRLDFGQARVRAEEILVREGS